jgi:hypothetical protein
MKLSTSQQRIHLFTTCLFTLAITLAETMVRDEQRDHMQRTTMDILTSFQQRPRRHTATHSTNDFNGNK